MSRFAAPILALLLAPIALGQPTAGRPAFDIADIHPSPHADWVKNLTHSLQGGFLMGDRYELHRATMLDLIRLAYNVDADKVFGGPAWLDYDRFEIAAKTKPGTRPEALRLMLQSLLEDRFRLAVKMDTREVPGYLLTAGKGEPKFKPAAETANTGGCVNQRPQLDGGVMTVHIDCHGITMAAFAASVRRMVAGPLRNLPVLDSTGLEGSWDIDFAYTAARIVLGGDGTQSPTSQDAGVVQGIEKLGLKLEHGTVPQPVLVVDRVDQAPSANPAGIAAALPPLPPPQFEVASIKWPCNDNITMALRFEAGGRVTGTCEPLLSLIEEAWGLPLFAQPLGVPKWLSDGTTAHNISIFAKAPAGVAPDPQHNPEARDILHAMLRTLLSDRYKLQAHFEDRPMDSLNLVAAKPKLAKAEPSGRTGCAREGQQQQGRALLVRLVCRNMSMAQFAEQIPAYDTDVFYPVLDATGLEGAWDFTLNYDAMANLNARFPQFAGRGSAAPGEAAEPSGSIGFRDAVEKQLGLKFEVHKRAQPVLVIDHIEEKPTEN